VLRSANMILICWGVVSFQAVQALFDRTQFDEQQRTLIFFFFLALLEKKRCNVCSERAEKADPSGHQNGGNDPAERGDRIAVTVADRGDGGKGPPKGVARRLDVRFGGRFAVQDGDG